MHKDKILVKMNQFSFAYSSVDRNRSDGIRDISLEIREGEIVVVTGESGCGKTTLIRCLNGLIPDFYEGEIKGSCEICGMNIVEHETGDFSAHVGSVFQDPRSQFFTLHVKTEITFPSENLGVSTSNIQSGCVDAIDKFRLRPVLKNSIFELSSGEKQKVAIASVYVAGVKMFVLDEPSANLDTEGTEQLRQMILELKRQGHTVVISEHKLYYLSGVGDRFLLMEHGRIKKAYDNAQFSHKNADWFISKGLRQVDMERISLPIKKWKSIPDDKAVLRVKDLEFAYPGGSSLWRDVSFDVKRGEIIGIVGRNGSGKSSMLRVLMGLEKPKKGNVCIKGKYASKQKRRKHSFYVMQDVDYQFFASNVLDEMLSNGRTDSTKVSAAKAVLSEFGIAEYEKVHPSELSGGQKQRLAVALARMSQALFIYMDEPTSGLDASNMEKVRHSITKLSSEGCSVFVITHDYEFAAGLFDSLLVIQDNGSVLRIDPEKFDPSKLYHYMKNNKYEEIKK